MTNGFDAGGCPAVPWWELSRSEPKLWQRSKASARECEVRGETDRAMLLREASITLRAVMRPDALRRAEPDIAALMEAEGIAMRPGPRPVIAAGRPADTASCDPRYAARRDPICRSRGERAGHSHPAPIWNSLWRTRLAGGPRRQCARDATMAVGPHCLRRSARPRIHARGF